MSWPDLPSTPSATAPIRVTTRTPSASPSHDSDSIRDSESCLVTPVVRRFPCPTGARTTTTWCAARSAQPRPALIAARVPEMYRSRTTTTWCAARPAQPRPALIAARVPEMYRSRTTTTWCAARPAPPRPAPQVSRAAHKYLFMVLHDDLVRRPPRPAAAVRAGNVSLNDGRQSRRCLVIAAAATRGALQRAALVLVSPDHRGSSRQPWFFSSRDHRGSKPPVQQWCAQPTPRPWLLKRIFSKGAWACPAARQDCAAR